MPGPCRETQQCPRHTLLPLHSPHSSHTGLLPVPRMHWACSHSGPLHRLCPLPGPLFPQHSQGSFPTSIRCCSNATLSRGPSGTSICYCTAPTLSSPCLLAFKRISASVVYHPSSLPALVGRDLCLICSRPWTDSSGDIPRPCPPEAQKACHKINHPTGPSWRQREVSWGAATWALAGSLGRAGTATYEGLRAQLLYRGARHGKDFRREDKGPCHLPGPFGYLPCYGQGG